MSNESTAKAVPNSNEKENLKTRVGKPRFNWKIPIYGAIGFGIGSAVTNAIMLTIYNIAQNAFRHTVGADIGALRGIVVGAVGGAGLGWALKNKTPAYYFSLAGAIGFGVAFALVISIDSFDMSKIGWTIISFMGGPVGESIEVKLASGLGIGTLIGAIGGSALGMAFPKYRALSSLLLCLAGIISFANVFAFGCTIFDGYFDSLWNALGGAVGGATLGTALALCQIITERLSNVRTRFAG